jgi:hypothetical protein
MGDNWLADAHRRLADAEHGRAERMAALRELPADIGADPLPDPSGETGRVADPPGRVE